MPFNTTADNQALNALIASFTISGNTYSNLLAYATLHTAYSTSGANEVTGGGYARQAVTWNSTGPSGGSFATASVAGAFSIPANTTIAFVGLTSAASAALTATNFAGMGANGGAPIYMFTSSTHGGGDLITCSNPANLANGTPVVIWSGVGVPNTNGIPSALTVGTWYWILNYTAPTSTAAATFNLCASAPPSTTVLNLGTAPGCGLLQAITLETFSASGGTFTLTSDTLSLS